ncbi:MAG: biopolymer transporter ExbD [Chlamydiia bacterium]|nr:biopolymer transporter ExbD [Chlamydiia bacterium]
MRILANDDSDDFSVNLTPLIDVVFVILIMFIVIAPLLDLDQIELANSSESASSTSLQEKGPLKITVFADNSIKINGHSVDCNDLGRYFAFAKKRFPDAHPQLFLDKQAQFGTYQTIKNRLEEAGFESLDVILRPN